MGHNGSVSDRRTVTLLGSTGSIGTQAVDVVRAAPERFRVVGLSAGGANLRLLAEQAVLLGVEVVGVAAGEAEHLDAALTAAAVAAGRPGARPEIVVGAAANDELAARPVDVVLNGVTGAVGLSATIAALRAGNVLALANKESLIVGGSLVRGAAAPGQIVPVDSEHSAIAQCLRAGTSPEVARLVLTASGGPFRGMSRHELHDVTPAQALAHPTWDMGRVVTTNSATLVNKGLEVIEAHLLFDIPFDDIAVVVHPQSIVHSMVEFVDGSTILQASPPDMRLPIALAMAWPERVPGAATPCDWSTAATWEFQPLDDDAFPAVRLARTVGREGGIYPAVYNAANEVCVDAFHDRQIRFTDIVDAIEQVVDRCAESDGSPRGPLAGSEPGALDVEGVLRADAWARDEARLVLGLDRPPQGQESER